MLLLISQSKQQYYQVLSDDPTHCSAAGGPENGENGGTNNNRQGKANRSCADPKVRRHTKCWIQQPSGAKNSQAEASVRANRTALSRVHSTRGAERRE
jgi:hypothetical protein